MMDYSLCRHTVTVYRRETRQRQVMENCYLEYTDGVNYDITGRQVIRPFLLIVPGGRQVFVDDLIYDGVGPVLTEDAWRGFVPANEPRLMQVQYVTDYGCHTEAGRGKYGLPAI